MQREIVGKLLFEAHRRLFYFLQKKKKRNWTASIKVNKKIRLCTKQILTTRLVIVKFFPLLRKHPFTLPDNLTICKIASRADPGSDVTRLTFSSAIPVKVFSKFHRLLSIRLLN